MESRLTAEDIDLIMDYIPCTTDMGENTELWNKLKRMKSELAHDTSDVDSWNKEAYAYASYCKDHPKEIVVYEDFIKSWRGS